MSPDGLELPPLKEVAADGLLPQARDRGHPGNPAGGEQQREHPRECRELPVDRGAGGIFPPAPGDMGRDVPSRHVDRPPPSSLFLHHDFPGVDSRGTHQLLLGEPVLNPPRDLIRIPVHHREM